MQMERVIVGIEQPSPQKVCARSVFESRFRRQCVIRLTVWTRSLALAMRHTNLQGLRGTLLVSEFAWRDDTGRLLTRMVHQASDREQAQKVKAMWETAWRGRGEYWRGWLYWFMEFASGIAKLAAGVYLGGNIKILLAVL